MIGLRLLHRKAAGVNWEQGHVRPNAQAALLINLVKQYPDEVQRLAEIGTAKGRKSRHWYSSSR